MRTYKFRGKKKDNGEWVYGDLIHYYKNDLRILEQNKREWDIQEASYEVIPETVGQYAGVRDKNGNEIYEGDIIRVNNIYNVKVVWGDNVGDFLFIDNKEKLGSIFFDKVAEQSVIIGSIYDNPKLLEGDKK